jgi:hypothetical protein
LAAILVQPRHPQHHAEGTTPPPHRPVSYVVHDTFAAPCPRVPAVVLAMAIIKENRQPCGFNGMIR